MSDLVEFLLARITEDEHDAEGMAVWDDGSSQRRALAECEAKRRIIGLHHSQPNWTERQHNEPGPRAVFDVIFDTLECAECSGSIISDLVDWPCPTLRLLSLPYADHPDYRAEWRP